MTGAIQNILFLMVKISDILKLLTMCMKFSRYFKIINHVHEI